MRTVQRWRDMKTRSRYLLLFSGLLLYLFLLLFGRRLFSVRSSPSLDSAPSAFDDVNEAPLRPEQRIPFPSTCSMSTCFNFSRCVSDRLRVYVYPDVSQDGEGAVLSETYGKIVRAIRESAFYTDNPDEACLLVLGLDTIDRDRISEAFVRDMPALVEALPKNVWRGGENHVIFNLYHGTYPDYADHNLGFSTGKAIVARASASGQHFRHGFDLSFPLFHKQHLIRDSIQRPSSLRDRDPLLVSFKGKRYVYGIGSETRDSLHHLHQNITPDDVGAAGEAAVAMLTTCRHNHDWQAHQDERCERDNEQYEKWDYEELMANSTFCLTPRGRRLGSFRFLESLRVGCIPVVLSDDWQLPFAEVIDWSAAVVRVYEKNVLLVTEILSSFPRARILRMKQRVRLLYHRHLASVEKITLTALQIIWNRARRAALGLAPSTASSTSSSLLPFRTAHDTPYRVTVVVRAAERSSSRLQKTMHKLQGIAGAIDKVFVLWPNDRGVMPTGADFGLQNTEPSFLPIQNTSMLPLEELADGWAEPTDNSAILFLSERSSVTSGELAEMLRLFNQQPRHILTRDAIEWQPSWQESHSGISYNFALLHATFIHAGYIRLARDFLPSAALARCGEAALNLLVASHTHAPPRVYRTPESRAVDRWDTTVTRKCLESLANRWPEGAPLVSSTTKIF